MLTLNEDGIRRVYRQWFRELREYRPERLEEPDDTLYDMAEQALREYEYDVDAVRAFCDSAISCQLSSVLRPRQSRAQRHRIPRTQRTRCHHQAQIEK